MSIHTMCDFPGCQAAGTVRIEKMDIAEWLCAAIPIAGNLLCLFMGLIYNHKSVTHLCAYHAKEIFREGKL